MANWESAIGESAIDLIGNWQSKIRNRASGIVNHGSCSLPRAMPIVDRAIADWIADSALADSQWPFAHSAMERFAITHCRIGD
jgi:hypothetical protein